jgi:hypothetical protein
VKTVGVNIDGRRIGEDHPNAKLTDAQCDEIRALAGQGVKGTYLAKCFGVSGSCINKIVSGSRRWEKPIRDKLVDDDEPST